MTELFRPLVLATGVFDLLHAEHVHLLEEAKKQGMRLVVGINSDESVRRLKGPNRPIIGQDDRMAMLSALRCVERVYVFEEDTPIELINQIRPDVLVKGSDYAAKALPEAEALKKWRGRVWIAPTSRRITTGQIINRIRSLP